MTSTAATPNILDAALAYADRGWEVVRLHTIRSGRCTCGKANCDSPGKHPSTRNGLNDATVDRRKIRRWWREHPDDNVGVRTGKTSGIVVVDVDSYKLDDDPLDALVARYGALPETVEAITGGGGRHLVFRHPRGGVYVPNSSEKLGPGIDVRGDGGYIVVKPSLHNSDRRYEWEPSHVPGEHKVAELPDWLLELVRKRPEAAAGPTTDNGEAKPPTDDRRERCLAAMLAMQTRDGKDGSKRLYACACRCVEHDLSDDDAFAVIRAYACLRPFPRKWSPDDFRQRLRDADAASDVKRGAAVSRERVVFVRMADVEEERVDWLWFNRFPRRKLSLIAGMQGLGKTFVVLDMAARVSSGTSWPDYQNVEQGSVVLLNLEDGLGDTIRPRLTAMGADLAKIGAIEGLREVDKSGVRTFNIVQDIHHLDQIIEQLSDVRLVILDPLTAYIGSEVNSWKDNEVRAVLYPLGELARRHDVAVIGVMHLRKSPSDKAMFRVLGSVAFTAYARAVWLVGEDRDDPERRLMLPVKLNIAKAAPGLAFTIAEPGFVEWSPDQLDVTADEAFAGGAEHPDEAGPKVRAAMEWLTCALANGAIAAKDVKKQARENCITARTLERAKTRLEVVSSNKGVIGDAWYWYPPGTSPEETADGETET